MRISTQFGILKQSSLPSFLALAPCLKPLKYINSQNCHNIEIHDFTEPSHKTFKKSVNSFQKSGVGLKREVCMNLTRTVSIAIRNPQKRGICQNFNPLNNFRVRFHWIGYNASYGIKHVLFSFVRVLEKSWGIPSTFKSRGLVPSPSPLGLPVWRLMFGCFLTGECH